MKVILIFPIWLFVVYGVEVIVINTIRNRPSWPKPAVVHTLYSIPRLNYVIGTIDGGTAVSKAKLNYKEIEINSGIVIPKSKERTILDILDSIFSPAKTDYGIEEISSGIAVSKSTPWPKPKLNYEEIEINRGIVIPKPEENTFLDILGSILSPPKVDYGREEISGAIAVSKPTHLLQPNLNYGIEEIVGGFEVSKPWPKPKCPNQQLNYGGGEISGGIIIPKPKKITIHDILDRIFSPPKINYGREKISGGILVSKPTPSPKPKRNSGEKKTSGRNVILKPKKIKILDILDSKFSPPKINYGRGKMSGGILVSKPTPSSKPKLNYEDKKTTGRNVIPKPKKSKYFDIFTSTFRPPKFNYEKGKITGGIPVSKSTPSPKPKLNYEEKKTSGRNVIPKPKENKILDKLGSTFNPPKTEYGKGKISGKKSVSKPTPKPKLNFGKGKKSSGIGVSKHTPLPKPKRNYGEKKISGGIVTSKPKEVQFSTNSAIYPALQNSKVKNSQHPKDNDAS